MLALMTCFPMLALTLDWLCSCGEPSLAFATDLLPHIKGSRGLNYKVNRITTHCDMANESVHSLVRGHMIRVCVGSMKRRCPSFIFTHVGLANAIYNDSDSWSIPFRLRKAGSNRVGSLYSVTPQGHPRSKSSWHRSSRSRSVGRLRS